MEVAHIREPSHDSPGDCWFVSLEERIPSVRRKAYHKISIWRNHPVSHIAAAQSSWPVQGNPRQHGQL